MTQNPSITDDMLAAVQELNRFVTLPDIAAQFEQAVVQALAELGADDTYSVVNLPLSDLQSEPPPLLGTIRIAAFRPNKEMGQERHANSTQFLYSLRGKGETRVLRDEWERDVYGETQDGALEERWHVVKPGVWHQSIALGNEPWVLAALHTAKDVQDEFRP